MTHKEMEEKVLDDGKYWGLSCNEKCYRMFLKVLRGSELNKNDKNFITTVFECLMCVEGHKYEDFIQSEMRSGMIGE